MRVRAQDGVKNHTCLWYHWLCLRAQILNLPPLPIFGFDAKYIIIFVWSRPFEHVNNVRSCGDSSKSVLLVGRLPWIIGGYRV